MTKLSLSQKGNKHYKWDETLTKEYRESRYYRGHEFKAWSKNVFKNNNYKCDCCGSGKRLHAHHIFDMGSHKDKKFDLDNGVTLCSVCHKIFHVIVGQKCTQRDYDIFKECYYWLKIFFSGLPPSRNKVRYDMIKPIRKLLNELSIKN